MIFTRPRRLQNCMVFHFWPYGTIAILMNREYDSHEYVTRNISVTGCLNSRLYFGAVLQKKVTNRTDLFINGFKLVILSHIQSCAFTGSMEAWIL